MVWWPRAKKHSGLVGVEPPQPWPRNESTPSGEELPVDKPEILILKRFTDHH